MHLVTFFITAFELVMLFFQIIYWLQRPNDKKRLLYFILLLFLIFYNLTSGFLPDKNFFLPVMVQNIMAYLIAFSMSIYFVYYFYKAFDLNNLKFFATYGSLVFLFLPFLLLFVIPYIVTNDLDMVRQVVVVVPFIYGLTFIYFTTKAFMAKVQQSKIQKIPNEESQTDLIIAAYIALLCWATLPVIVFFGDFQVLEHSVTNAGFLMMTLIYVKTSIRQSRWEYNKLMVSQQNHEEILEENYKRYSLTTREIQVVNLLARGHSYKIIAESLHISEKTVARHVSNVFSKTHVTNKLELVNTIESRG
jgi:DNA-binding CsgD family transcriptional regulator